MVKIPKNQGISTPRYLSIVFPQAKHKMNFWKGLKTWELVFLYNITITSTMFQATSIIPALEDISMYLTHAYQPDHPDYSSPDTILHITPLTLFKRLMCSPILGVYFKTHMDSYSIRYMITQAVLLWLFSSLFVTSLNLFLLFFSLLCKV